LYPAKIFIGNELPVKVERLDPPPPFGQEKVASRPTRRDGKLGRRWSLAIRDIRTIWRGVLPGVMAKSGRKALFEDTDEIIRYVKRTQIYPIIHIMTIKEETWRSTRSGGEADRSVSRANRLAPKYFKNGDAVGYAKEREVLGYDPYALCSPTLTKRVSRP